MHFWPNETTSKVSFVWNRSSPIRFWSFDAASKGLAPKLSPEVDFIRLTIAAEYRPATQLMAAPLCLYIYIHIYLFTYLYIHIVSLRSALSFLRRFTASGQLPVDRWQSIWVTISCQVWAASVSGLESSLRHCWSVGVHWDGSLFANLFAACPLSAPCCIDWANGR